MCIRDRCNKSTDKYLSQLNSFGLPVLLIGGQVSLPDQDPKLDNINFLIERMANLIDEPLWDMEQMKPTKGKLTNTIDWQAVERMQDSYLHEQFKVEIRQLRKKHDVDLNYNYFPDMGHGGRWLHKLASFKIIEFINENNLSQQKV